MAARQADPDCRLAMGCAGVDLPFLERLYEFGCGPYFDVMAVHPYQWGRTFSDGWMLEKLHGCRQLMDRHGDGHKEIWATEFGWSIGEGVTAQEQADLLVQAAVTFLSVRERLRVENFLVAVKDWGGPGFGCSMMPASRSPPFWPIALRRPRSAGPAIARVENARGCAGPRLRSTRQTDPGARTPAPDGKIHVELKTAAKLSLRTVGDQVLDVTASGGKAAVEVTHDPVFITGMNNSELEPIAAPSSSPAAGRQQAAASRCLAVGRSPTTTARPYLVLGGANEFPLRVHNDGAAAAAGEVQMELASEDGIRRPAECLSMLLPRPVKQSCGGGAAGQR